MLNSFDPDQARHSDLGLHLQNTKTNEISFPDNVILAHLSRTRPK